ncbi:hypothetical protein HZC30_01575 [Candidatus Woesearchaeota archaeon]|nr:hypothetical protein [Candidatus Woesearchaeota archaeon]
MFQYFSGKMMAAKYEGDRIYSKEVERFYREARHKEVEDIKTLVRCYDNNRWFSKFCQKIGISKELARVVGYRIRLEEILSNN